MINLEFVSKALNAVQRRATRSVVIHSSLCDEATEHHQK
jgi:hypothetical protein